MAKNTGTVIQVMGPVLDIRFEDGQLPELLSAIQVKNGDAVKEGDPIATVDRVTVMNAIAAAQEAMEDLADTDWVENCAAAIRKKYGEIPEDKGERQKLIAALMRLGYDTDTVREAMREILRKS